MCVWFHVLRVFSLLGVVAFWLLFAAYCLLIVGICLQSLWLAVLAVAIVVVVVGC